MMKNLFSLWILILLAVSSGSVKSPKPHIIFLLADDLGYNDVSYHGKTGGSAILTPTIDKLAKTGVILENYYVQPICTPTRSQLMSGRYQIHTGLMHSVIKPPYPYCLPLDEVTLPQKLKENGYATHMVGKWHLGFYKPSCLPINRGFDSFFGYLLGEEDYFEHTRSYQLNNETMEGLDYHNGTEPVRDHGGVYSLFTFVGEVERILGNHNPSEPLFLYVAFQNVHSPLQVPEQYSNLYPQIKKSERQKYAGMTSALDEAVANITRKLRETGLYDNSIIIFSTDNGGPIGSANNWPLRGSKSTMWEGGVHGVGFVHSPVLPRKVVGTINREFMHVSDWLPTLVAGVAGGSLNGTKPLDGYNVWDCIINGTPSPRKELLHNIDPLAKHPKMIDSDCWDDNSKLQYDKAMQQLKHSKFNSSMAAALRVGDWKILTGINNYHSVWYPPPESGITPISPIRNKTQGIWLFNIAKDPNERYDLSLKYPNIVKALLKKLGQYWKTSVPVLNPEPDPQANPKYHGGVWQPWRSD